MALQLGVPGADPPQMEQHPGAMLEDHGAEMGRRRPGEDDEEGLRDEKSEGQEQPASTGEQPAVRARRAPNAPTKQEIEDHMVSHEP